MTQTVAYIGLGIIALALAAVAIRHDFWLKMRVGWTVIGQFVLTIALPLSLLLGLPLLALSANVPIDVRIWQAVIAGAFVALGWLATAIFAEVGKIRDRSEKLRDFHRAIYAEMRPHLAALGSDSGLDAHADQVVARMQSDPDFVPFIPTETNDRIFKSLVAEIQILPRETIDPIVEYYAQLAVVAEMARDMRGDTFKSLSQERRILMYRDYIDLKKQVLAFGRFAIGMIETYAALGPMAARRKAAKEMGIAGISTPGAVPSGR